jgi:hypothetical protein
MTARCKWCGWWEPPRYRHRPKCSYCRQPRGEKHTAMVYIQWIRILSGREPIPNVARRHKTEKPRA